MTEMRGHEGRTHETNKTYSNEGDGQAMPEPKERPTHTSVHYDTLWKEHKFDISMSNVSTTL